MFNEAKKKGLRREDFIFQNGWFDTLVRKPGELHMQQFQISDCEECKIYLFDSSACVYIDDCKYCYIFIGPCEASTFIRNCEYMHIICMTQQFRMRDCNNCTVNLWCESQPIIESSFGIQIDCFNGKGYKQLYDQMKEAKLNLWNNNWFDIYDFTPRKFSLDFNYHLKSIRQNQGYERKLKELKMKPINHMIPFSTGILEKEPYRVIIIYPIPKKWSKHLLLIHSRTAILPSTLTNLISSDFINQECLFVKVLKEEGEKWAEEIEDIVKIIQDEESLNKIENQIFLPFRDQH